MMELYVVRSDGTFQLPVQSVEWSGEKLAAPRTLTATVLSTQRGLHQKQPVNMGNQLIFRWKGEELFRGTIFARDRTRDGSLSLTAYDQLIYLTQNTDSYIFVGKTLAEIVRRICKDFDIPVGTIADTPHRLTRSFEGQTLFDMILACISLTYKHTGVKYYIYASKGKVNLVKRVDMAHKWVVEDGANLMDYSLSETLEETATRVKLVAGEAKKAITAKVDAGWLQKSYGVLQYFENVSENVNKAQLMARAEQALRARAKPGETLSVDALGIPDVISGGAVYVIVAELGVHRAFYIDQDMHSFSGNTHTMSLTLNRTDDLPEIDAASITDAAGDGDSESDKEKDDPETFAQRLKKELFGGDA
ncbi:XkdQ/YqbQ family protein [Paenibacillus sanguinis]|uniref:XkdQ/YqbQ family protein n=1 Tax=Paenibacillus sanguinis TaxID=225906 RepID=UPI00037B025B|nr:hypothetical protein [Paenibacillus sanguinis]